MVSTNNSRLYISDYNICTATDGLISPIGYDILIREQEAKRKREKIRLLKYRIPEIKDVLLEFYNNEYE